MEAPSGSSIAQYPVSMDFACTSSVATLFATLPDTAGLVALNVAFSSNFLWARLDSNQGPTNYEFAALTS